MKFTGKSTVLFGKMERENLLFSPTSFQVTEHARTPEAYFHYKTEAKKRQQSDCLHQAFVAVAEAGNKKIGKTYRIGKM